MMVHQLHLGLSQAGYVSLDGNLVGLTQLTSSGWQLLADKTIDDKLY
ncbi:MAG: hypothetical protein HRT53_15785 [Colwellia sp.]|nr:hypothetical protein [Colwellia sp.]